MLTKKNNKKINLQKKTKKTKNKKKNIRKYTKLIGGSGSRGRQLPQRPQRPQIPERQERQERQLPQRPQIRERQERQERQLPQTPSQRPTIIEYESTLESTDDYELSTPMGVAVSAVDNRIYVADSGNHCVKVFDGATRNYIATLGNTGVRGFSDTSFSNPCGVAVSSDNHIYVADQSNHCVKVFDGANLNYIDSLGSDYSGVDNTEFINPNGVAVSADNLIYVSDQGNNRVQVFDGATRRYIATLGTTGEEGSDNMHFNNPMGVAVSTVDNHIYVADCDNHRVQVFDGATHNYIYTLGITDSDGDDNMHFYYPTGVAVSADNRIYVSDQGNERVQIFNGATFNYIATLGTTGESGTSNTQFNYPHGVAVSAVDNRIYVADYGNYRVQVFKAVILPSYQNSIRKPPPYSIRTNSENNNSDPSPPYIENANKNTSNYSLRRPSENTDSLSYLQQFQLNQDN